MSLFSEKYEEFVEPDGFSKQSTLVDPRDVENEKLVSFEEGYQAGWDDAAEAQQRSETHFSDTLTENLQEISFGFHEAKAALTSEMQTLFEEVLDTLLPEVIKISVGPLIMEKILSITRDKSDQMILTEVSTADFPPLKTFFETQNLSSFELKERADLTLGQVLFRVGGNETEIDFKHTLQEIKSSVSTLFEKG